MTKTRIAICIATALMSSGCLLPRPEPFVRSVSAAPLRPVGAPASPAAPEPASLPEAAPAAPEPSPLTAEAGPARTNIEGAGDGSMKIDRVVVTPHKLARRAPDYSPEQTASMVCLAQRMDFAVGAARRAHEATLAAAAVNARQDQGLATQKESSDAELKRQDAVRGFIMPVPVVGLFFDGARKKSDLPKPVHGDVVIENADLFIFTEHGKEVMAVSGVARNTGASRAELPPMTLVSLDAWEFQLAGQTSLLPFEALEPGEARAFEIRFHNPPSTTAEVYIHFAPPFAYRSRRDCDFFDPAVFDAAGALDAQTAAAPGPVHTSAELNILTQFYRREAAEAWRCREWTEKGCGWARNALRWRDMFEMSEAIDAAWIAQRAAATGDSAAESARAQAFAAFAALGDAALSRAGATVPGIAVSLTRSVHGRDRDGLYLDIAGNLTNTSDEPRAIDALMLAFMDRLDLPLSSMAIGFARTLQPGETAAFVERFPVAQGYDPERSLTIRRDPPHGALARVPPPSIPWEIRVGAMAP